MEEYISELKLDFVDADNVKTVVSVCVGKPSWCSSMDAWKCEVLFGDKDSAPKEIYGNDSMQAVCLALKFIESSLIREEQKNINIFYHSTNDKFPVSAYF